MMKIEASPPTVKGKEPGFKPEFFAELYELEAANFWFRSRNRLIIWALEKYFGDCKTFLEVGCGTGFVLTGVKRAFPQLRCSGSELFREGLQFASKRLPDVELFELDARALPFHENFELIGAFDVIEHIEEDEKVLFEFWKATSYGLILTVPQHRFLWSVIDDLGGHKRRYSRKELQTKLEKSGFRVIRITSFVSFLLPLLVLSRFKKREAKELDHSELAIPRVLDLLLELVLSIERFFIRIGINFPAGGSLLAIAVKQKL